MQRCKLCKFVLLVYIDIKGKMVNKNISKYGNKFTSENARYYQKKGVMARKENKKEALTLQQLAYTILNSECNDAEGLEVVKEVFPNIKGKITNNLAMLARVAKEAKKGNIESIKALYNWGLGYLVALPYLNLEGLLNSIDTTSNKLQEYIQDVSLFSGDEISNLVKANDHLMRITAFKIKLFDYGFNLISKEVKAQEYQKEVERDPLGLEQAFRTSNHIAIEFDD